VVLDGDSRPTATRQVTVQPSAPPTTFAADYTLPHGRVMGLAAPYPG
jgi:hypothetical protein